MSDIIEEYAEYLKEQGYCLKDLNQRDAVVSDLNPLNESFLTYRTISNHFCKWCTSVGSFGDWKPEYWYNIRDNLPLVVGSCFKPNGPDFVSFKEHINYKNLWTPFVPLHSESPAGDFLFAEAMERLFPKPEDLKMVTEWLAHMLQRPEERPSFHLMFRSDHGTGKGFLFNKILYPLLNRQAYSFSSFSSVTEKHATFLEDGLLVFLDDVIASSPKQQHQLKSMLTEERQTIRPLNEKQKTIRTYARFILTSNEDEPIKLEEQDRRWYVTEKIKHKIDEEETKAFYKVYGEWIEDPYNLSLIYNHLMNIDLSDFNPKQHIRTDAFWNMLEQGQTVYDNFAEEWIEEHPVFTYSELQQKHDIKTVSIIIDKLKTMGYTKSKLFQRKPDLRERSTHNTLYWIPKGMTLDDAREYLSPGSTTMNFPRLVA